MMIRTFKARAVREQGSLLPARLDDDVAPDNPGRAIEVSMRSLDLAALKRANRDFVLLRSLESGGGAVVAIDGTFSRPATSSCAAPTRSEVGGA